MPACSACGLLTCSACGLLTCSACGLLTCSACGLLTCSACGLLTCSACGLLIWNTPCTTSQSLGRECISVRGGACELVKWCPLWFTSRYLFQLVLCVCVACRTGVNVSHCHTADVPRSLCNVEAVSEQYYIIK